LFQNFFVLEEWKMFLCTGKLILYKLRLQQENLQFYICLEIAHNHAWEVKLCGKVVDRDNQLLTDLPELLLTSKDVCNVLEKLDHDAHVCTGNEDSQFEVLATARGGVFSDRTSKCGGCVPVMCMHAGVLLF
jgi:hypothetical protein